MAYPLIQTHEYTTALRKLVKAGKTKQTKNAYAAASEFQTTGEIRIIHRTNHGETRLPNIEKYDLTEGYRLVVQVLNPDKKEKAFLFIGDHDDAEQWLNSHKNYKFVRRESDNTLDFIVVNESKDNRFADRSININLDEEDSNKYLLSNLLSSDWETLNFPSSLSDYLKKISYADWEMNQDGIFDHILGISTEIKALLALDLLHLSYIQDYKGINTRIELLRGNAEVIPFEDLADKMLSPENSEEFISWETAKDFFDAHPEGTWEDWMLFLHPEQHKLANKDFNGPARLRGVSGSGKTTVMLHRARYLARTSQGIVCIVTLTESMRKLLDSLLDKLCGLERGSIKTYTVSNFTKDLIIEIDPDFFIKKVTFDQNAGNTKREEINLWLDKNYQFFESIAKGNKNFLYSFIEQELNYIKQRLLVENYHFYTESKYKRVGRGIPLSENQRNKCLELVKSYENRLIEQKKTDHEGMVQHLVGLLKQNKKNNFKKPIRSILIDEVQDLSQLEMEIFSQIRFETELLSSLENGLFLVGDGTQSIYNKGFSLNKIGITLNNRSFAFKKNYRNTYEILKAAYSLVQDFEFADIDEDNYQKPLVPELATKHGEKPEVIKCDNFELEIEIIVEKVKKMLADEICSPGQICIIGNSQKSRKLVAEKLMSLRIQNIELKSDADVASKAVKISTIESAKGHEFSAVFILGLNDFYDNQDESRVASRLYVAMTRACNILVLTYSMRSQFKIPKMIASIQSNCLEYEYMNKKLKLL